jgi:hypothetical protein
MAETDDATELRRFWSPEFLGDYEGKWVAFRAGDLPRDLPSSISLQQLLTRFQREIDVGKGPILAFVTFAEVFV